MGRALFGAATSSGLGEGRALLCRCIDGGRTPLAATLGCLVPARWGCGPQTPTCGIESYCIASLGTAWHGVAWRGAAFGGMAWLGMVQHGVAWHNMA